MGVHLIILFSEMDNADTFGFFVDGYAYDFYESAFCTIAKFCCRCRCNNDTIIKKDGMRVERFTAAERGSLAYDGSFKTAGGNRKFCGNSSGGLLLC